MKIKSNLRSGITTEDVNRLTQDISKGVQTVANEVSKAISPVIQNVQKVVSNPKFWTWPL